MTAHPIDAEALRRLADAAMVEPPWEDAGEWQTDGYAEYVVLSCEQDSDGEYDHVAEAANERLGAFIAAADPNTVRALLDARAAAEYRATRAEKWAALWKETARRAIRGERVLFRVNRQTREQMERERGHLFRVAAERNDAAERAERAEQHTAALEAVVDRVRELHQPVGLTEHTGPRTQPDGTPIPEDTPVCGHCTDPDALGWVDYPCLTIKALDGT